MAAQFRHAVEPARLSALAVELGVSIESLERLGIGWTPLHGGAWAFPMKDAGGTVVGVRLRRPDGRKLAVKGGREGLFVPEELKPSPEATLFLVEGVSDLAAALDLNLPAIGRPSCAGGTPLIVALVERLKPGEVVIVADSDKPGRQGARRLADALAERGVRVRIILPPGGAKDLREALRAGLKREQLTALVEAAPLHESASREKLPETITARELQTKKFTRPRMIVENLLLEGLTIIAGKPKKGKSWLLLCIAIAIAMSRAALGRLKTTGGVVLYLALEDSDERIQSRMHALVGDEPWPEDLHFNYKWPRLDRGGLLALSEWKKAHPRLAVVVVDTFPRIRPPKTKTGDSYLEDAEVTAVLQSWALENHIALVLLAHQRKAAADDVFDTISGTLGTTASADVLGVLTRAPQSGEGRLDIVGRDIVERALALAFEGGHWTYIGEAEDAEPKTPDEIAEEFLREILADGALESEVIFNAAKERGIARKRVWTTKERMGIKAKKIGFQGTWHWSLPTYKEGNALVLFEEKGNALEKRESFETVGNALAEDSPNRVKECHSVPAERPDPELDLSLSEDPKGVKACQSVSAQSNGAESLAWLKGFIESGEADRLDPLDLRPGVKIADPWAFARSLVGDLNDGPPACRSVALVDLTDFRRAVSDVAR